MSSVPFVVRLLFGSESSHHEGHEEHEAHKEALPDEPLQSISEHGNVEVDQQPGVDARQLHVSQKLRLMDTQHLFDSLQLHDQAPVDQKIHPVTAIQADSLVVDRQRPLQFEGNTSEPSGESQGPSLSACRQSSLASSMNLTNTSRSIVPSGWVPGWRRQ